MQHKREVYRSGGKVRVYKSIKDRGGKAIRKEDTREERNWWVNDITMDVREIACGGMD
jgi:hypothetical protein